MGQSLPKLVSKVNTSNRYATVNVEQDDMKMLLIMAQEEEGCTFAQKNDSKGAQRVLSPDHIDIDTCGTYASMSNKDILNNLKMQSFGLCGHTNSGSTMMDQAGALRAVENVWFNKHGVAEKMGPVLYQPNRGMNLGKFIIHTDSGDIAIQNLIGMVFLNMIANFDVTESAVKNACIIFGPNLTGGGRTVVAMESVWVKHIQISWVILD